MIVSDRLAIHCCIANSNEHDRALSKARYRRMPSWIYITLVTDIGYFAAGVTEAFPSATPVANFLLGRM